MRPIDSIVGYFGKQSKPFLITSNILILLVIGLVDYITGYQVSISLFYLIPISFAVWSGGKAPGIFISVLSLVTIAATDFMAGKEFPHYFVDLWNLLLYLGFFVVYALVLSQVKADFDKRRRLLQTTLDEVKQLRGLLPICASCKKIRDDKGYWNQIETYISKHSDAGHLISFRER